MSYGHLLATWVAVALSLVLVVIHVERRDRGNLDNLFGVAGRICLLACLLWPLVVLMASATGALSAVGFICRLTWRALRRDIF